MGLKSLKLVTFITPEKPHRHRCEIENIPGIAEIRLGLHVSELPNHTPNSEEKIGMNAWLFIEMKTETSTQKLSKILRVYVSVNMPISRGACEKTCKERKGK